MLRDSVGLRSSLALVASRWRRSRLADEGDDAQLTTGDLDARVDKALFQTRSASAGQASTTARRRLGLQASLSRVRLIAAQRPFLAHRPELQASVTRPPWRRSDSMPTMTEVQKAFAAPGGPRRASASRLIPSVSRTSLWARLGRRAGGQGGRPRLRGLRAAADPKPSTSPEGASIPIDADGVAHGWNNSWSSWSAPSAGGPLNYTGSRHEVLARRHGHHRRPVRCPGPPTSSLVLKSPTRCPSKEIDELVGIIATTRKDIVEDSAPAAPKPAVSAAPPIPVDPSSLWARLGRRAGGQGGRPRLRPQGGGRPEAVDFTRGGKYTLDAAGLGRPPRGAARPAGQLGRRAAP